MSKKQKIKKKITVPQQSPEKIAAARTQTKKSVEHRSELILFDRRTNLFLLIILLGYLIFSSLKIHTSNIANWDLYFGAESSESVIAGKPRFIRMDEWMISTPAALGQYNAGLPLSNSSVGDLNAPVVWGLPVKDISSLLRPAIWPYFIFDIERAFAFAWNFNIAFFLAGTFLVLMLLTRNNFWLSVSGTFFIFLSGGLQWWSYFIGNYMLYLNGMFISVIYFLYSKKLWTLIVAALIFILSSYGFMFNLYPPFQVPLLWLYLFLLAGFLLQKKNFPVFREKLQLKAIVAAASCILLIFFLYHYYHLVRDTYTMMMNTVYPGRRISTGGDLREGKLFADFFGNFMWDTHAPVKWQNICEASGFIMFFPIVFYAMGYYYYKTKKTDPLLISISVFFLIGLIYVLIGFPVFLSKITLFSMSPAFRALPIVGLANCFLLIGYIASEKTQLKNENFKWVEFVVIAVSSTIFIRVVSSYINKATDNFFSSTETWIVTAIIVISYLLVRYKNFKHVRTALYIGLVALVIDNINVNPLTKGLDPIFENPLVVASKPIHEKDPSARWALFGSTRLTHLLKANGIDMLNSVKLVPPMKDMKVLDPAGKFDSIYNRYAWITMNSKRYSQYYGVNWNDTVVIRRPEGFQDGYTIYMDPCSPRLKKLGVKYFVFDTVPSPNEVRCMSKLNENSGLFIYKRNDE